MRILLAIMVFCAGLSQVQERKPVPSSGEACQGPLTDAYYQAVLDHALRPPNWQTSLISISVSGPYAQWRVILREHGGKFELRRATTQNDVYNLLADLNSACHLSPNPQDAANRVKVTWENVELPAATFEQFHREFTSALAQYSANIQARYAPLLATRSAFINLHVAEYLIVFDNKFEHIEITADDTNSDPSKMDPIVRWTHGVLKLSDESFHKN